MWFQTAAGLSVADLWLGGVYVEWIEERTPVSKPCSMPDRTSWKVLRRPASERWARHLSAISVVVTRRMCGFAGLGVVAGASAQGAVVTAFIATLASIGTPSTIETKADAAAVWEPPMAVHFGEKNTVLPVGRVNATMLSSMPDGTAHKAS